MGWTPYLHSYGRFSSVRSQIVIMVCVFIVYIIYKMETKLHDMSIKQQAIHTYTYMTYFEYYSGYVIV